MTPGLKVGCAAHLSRPLLKRRMVAFCSCDVNRGLPGGTGGNSTHGQLEMREATPYRTGTAGSWLGTLSYGASRPLPVIPRWCGWCGAKAATSEGRRDLTVHNFEVGTKEIGDGK